ncbi:CDF: cation diffusion facilitator family transporter [compost metagenome]
MKAADSGELTREQASHLEQRTLTISLYGVVFAIVVNFGFGLYVQSDVVILNGVFGLLQVAGSALNLFAAKQIMGSGDRRFHQQGYWYLEPMANGFNGLMMLILCLYALINGVERIRGGGHPVDADDIVWFSLLSALYCALAWYYKYRVSLRVDSQLLKNDSRKWVIKLIFNLVTLVGFAALPFLNEPHRSFWANYADSSLVVVMALLLLPIPLRILRRGVSELLHLQSDSETVGSIESVMQAIRREHDINRYNIRVEVSGRQHFIEVDILVGPDFRLQSVAEQDQLRARISQAAETVLPDPLDTIWLSVSITADPRWVA